MPGRPTISLSRMQQDRRLPQEKSQESDQPAPAVRDQVNPVYATNSIDPKSAIPTQVG
jgi:hypothetical protein